MYDLCFFSFFLSFLTFAFVIFCFFFTINIFVVVAWSVCAYICESVRIINTTMLSTLLTQYAELGLCNCQECVCPSVCPSQHAPQQQDIDRLLPADSSGVWQTNAGSATLSAYVVAEHILVELVLSTVKSEYTHSFFTF